MRLTIAKFVFTIIIFVCWSTLSIANVDHFAIENYVNKSRELLCNNISLEFSNIAISEIKRDFINSPSITCLNLSSNSIEKIDRGAFDGLPNLTQLFLSNNKWSYSRDLLNFGSHDKLQVLIMNGAKTCRNDGYHNSYLQITGEYLNLEILSLSKHCIKNIEYNLNFDLISNISSVESWVPFPKLKILDLSENNIVKSNFVRVLPNSLYFLDLHDNLLERLSLKEKGNKLFALNLDRNNFSMINNQRDSISSLSMAGLKNLHYLSVYRNNINIITADAFKDNNELLFLNLSTNYLYGTHPETFSNLQYLKTLDLSRNLIVHIPEISIETEISTLHINNNYIIKINSHAFTHMPKLVKLLMAENKIMEIKVNAFAHLTVLEELDLSRNMLSSLPKGLAEPLVSLKYLDLRENKFTSLESLSLTNTPSIKILYLMNNPLKYLNVKYFENLPQNLTIDLINNSNFTTYINDTLPYPTYLYSEPGPRLILDTEG